MEVANEVLGKASSPAAEMDQSEKADNPSDEQGGSSKTTRAEDLQWLASLSKDELDFMIKLKEMAIRRAKHIGREKLGEKFDVRILRELGAKIIEHLKEGIRSTTPPLSNSAEMLTLLRHCRLATPSPKDSVSISCVIDTNTHVRGKRKWEGSSEEDSSRLKKPKIEETEI